MTLVKIAALGGMATCTMGLLWRYKVNENICKTEYYRDAMKTLRAHKGAIYLLGEPIKDYLLDISDKESNYTTAENAHYQVPVKGPKDKGKLYFWAKKNINDDMWTVNRIELELKSDKSKRLLVKSIE